MQVRIHCRIHHCWMRKMETVWRWKRSRVVNRRNWWMHWCRIANQACGGVKYFYQLNLFCSFCLPAHLMLIFLLIQIFIKTLTGRKQAFNFEPENEVLAVKQALQEKEGIQVDQIRLIHSGKQLWVHTGGEWMTSGLMWNSSNATAHAFSTVLTTKHWNTTISLLGPPFTWYCNCVEVTRCRFKWDFSKCIQWCRKHFLPMIDHLSASCFP